MSLAQKITRHYGGNWHGSYGCIPTDGHSAKDRGTSLKDAAEAPDGLLVNCHNGGDPLAEKDRFRRDGLLPAFEPKRANERAGDWRCTGTYEYDDGAGNVVYRTRRLEKIAEKKRFVAERRAGASWAAGLGELQRYPYRLAHIRAAAKLPDVGNAPHIYFVEGERKADKLAEMGFVATAVAFGSKGWRKEYAEHFRGASVIILPDNDDAGRSFAETVKSGIVSAGGKAHILELPGLPEKGDIIDWSGTADDIRRLTDEALRAPPSSSGLAFRKGVSARALMSKHFDPIRWIIPGVLSEGMYVLAGAPKLGKSWLALGWMLAVGSGGSAMGSIPCEEGDVLGLMLEDNQRRLQRRIRQMRLIGLPDRVTLMTEWPNLDDGCVTEIEAWIAGVPNPRLIVVDVFARVKGSKGGKETDYDFDYRQAALLQSIASAHGLAVVVVHHTRKMAADDPFDEVSGTRGLTGAADGVLVLKKDGGTQPVLYGRGRDLEEFESALQFDSETGTWSVIGAAWQVADTIERREIQQVLGRSVDPMSPTEIGERLGKSRANIAKMLSKMLDEGQVERVSTGRYMLVTPVTPFAPSTDTSVTRVTTPHTREDEPDYLADWGSGLGRGA